MTGPTPPGPLLAIHNISALLWLPMIAIHVFAYIQRIPRLIADDWRKPTAGQAPGRGFRLGVNLGMLLAGAIAAILVLPITAPWIAWSKMGQNVPAPLIVGIVIAALALLATRPLRWR